ncbi:MAG TPA: NADH:ubiquinone reductase (Na(+)-transporting) subunit D [Pseudomonadales bacterium]|nr:NADH:ubiquinone reductase (Na(+)-transporting) subunit D [Pseudomonadales bacterium]
MSQPSMTSRVQTLLRPLVRPLVDDNPVTMQILGLCSALAVSSALEPALIMSLSVTGVLAFSSVSISLLRRVLPRSIRLILEMTIIASAVIVVDETLKAFAPGISAVLTVFVGLIVTNCIVLGRAEAFALHNSVGASLADALGNGLGYSLILLTVAAVRELFGSGTLFEVPILPLLADGGWYRPNAMMQLAPSAFFLIALIIWGLRSWRTEQVEAPEFPAARSLTREAP